MAAFVKAEGIGKAEPGYPYPVFSAELVEKLLQPQTCRSRDYNSADTKLEGRGTPLAFSSGSDADKVLLICREEGGVTRPIYEEEIPQVIAYAEYADNQWWENINPPFTAYTVGVFETSRVPIPGKKGSFFRGHSQLTGETRKEIERQQAVHESNAKLLESLGFPRGTTTTVKCR